MLYLVLNNGEVSEGKTLRSCLHWMESSWPYPRSREEVEALPSPRIFKSHMPYHMALGGDPEPNPCKYIYIARNPKDVCVSYFHFESGKAWSGGYSGPWEHWLKLFMEGRVQRGSWFDHVLSWWRHKDSDNLLFLKYEDMKRDFDTQLRLIASYLGCDLKEVNDRAAAEGKRPLVFSTLVDPELRRIVATAEACHLDCFQIFIQPLEAELGLQSSHTIGRTHSASDVVNYHERIESINFALGHDDGVSTRDLAESDIILVGVSRCGKTPTCLYLALQYGIRAANYSLVPEDFASMRLPSALGNFKHRLYGLPFTRSA